MLPVDVFRDQPVLEGPSVRLELLTVAVFADYRAAMADAEVTRSTGTHASFSPAAVDTWLRIRRDQHDRADWAIVGQGGVFLGEAVINDFDPDNDSASSRVWIRAQAIRSRKGRR